MKKQLTAACTAVFLLLGGACSPSERDRVDYAAEDDRPISKRSAEVAGIHVEITKYGIYYTEYSGQKPAGRGYFFVVEYEVENVSDAVGEFNLDRVNVISMNGAEYPYTTYGTDSIGDGVNFSIKDFQPGERYTGVLVMEMPSGTMPDSIVFIGENRYGQVIDIPDIEGQNDEN